jgi:flagellar biosynthesis GTPase FlhF
MKVKTYTFDDIRKGMDTIKEQFGPDTIIMDIKQDNHNGNGWTKKGCEISIAVESDPVATLETDLGEVRKKTETIWSDAAKYLSERLTSIELDMFVDRLKSYPTPLKILHDKMLRAGLDRKIALSLVSEVFAEIGVIAENSTKALFFIKAKLGGRIRLCDIMSAEESILLIGPTGSGKSETAKKLSAEMSGRGLNPSVIAYDPMHKGTYGEFVNFSNQTGIPFQFAANVEDLARKGHAGSGKQVIDLTGHIAYQREAVQCFQHMKKIAVFPAGVSDDAIDYFLSTLEGTPVSGIVFTKIDEYDRFGCVCNSLLNSARPVAALTGGFGIADMVIPEKETFGKILLEGKAW